MRRLEWARASCAAFHTHRARVRGARKSVLDERAKEKQLADKIDKADKKGEDSTQFRGKLAMAQVGPGV